MAKKFSFKKLLFVGMLSVAGLFGASSMAMASDMPNFKAAFAAGTSKATVGSSGGDPLYETLSGVYYRKIFYYIDSDWDCKFRFDLDDEFTADTGQYNYHYYCYSTSSSDSDIQNGDRYSFGTGDPGDTCFSRIISDYAAVIYVPSSTKQVVFGSQAGSSRWDTLYTKQYNISSYGQAAVVTTCKWDDWPISTDNQEATWMPQTTFCESYLKPIKFTISSTWNNGTEYNLNGLWLWCVHVGSDGNQIGDSADRTGRAVKVTSEMIHTYGNGKYYAEVYVPARSGSQIRIQKSSYDYETDPNNSHHDYESSVLINVSDLSSDKIYAITTNDAVNYQSGAIFNFGESWDGTLTKIVVDDSWAVRTLKLAGTFSYVDTNYSSTQRNYFITQYYENEQTSWVKQNDQKSYWIENDNSIYLSAGVANNKSTFIIPSWITNVSEVYLINNDNTFQCGSLTNFANYCKNGSKSGDIGSVVGKQVTIDNFHYDDYGKANQGTATLGSAVPGEIFTVSLKYLTSSSTLSTTNISSYQYGLFPTSNPEDINGYLKVNSSWYSGTTYSASSTYTIPTLIMDTSTIELVGKYCEGKFVYFTNNKDWDGTVSCYFIASSVSSASFPGTAMTGMYNNNEGKSVYYTMVPKDTTLLIFSNGSNSKQTVDINITNGYLDNNHRAWYCTSDSNKYTVAEWDITSDNYPRFSGEKYYLYVNGEGISDNSGYALHFFDKCGSTVTASAWTTLGEEVIDAKEAFDVDYDIYEFTVPGVNKVWPAMIATRYDASKDPTSDGDSGIYNKTDDIWFTGEWHTIQLTGYGSGSPSMLNKAVSDVYTKYTVYSNIFGYHILHETDEVCISDGSTPISSLVGPWNSLKLEYDSYDEQIQYYIWEASDSGSSSLALGLARYDYICFFKRYSIITNTDFINRATASETARVLYGNYHTSTTTSLFAGNDNSSLCLIIIIVSSVSLLSITTLSILTIKKRKSKER